MKRSFGILYFKLGHTIRHS